MTTLVVWSSLAGRLHGQGHSILSHSMWHVLPQVPPPIFNFWMCVGTVLSSLPFFFAVQWVSSGLSLHACMQHSANVLATTLRPCHAHACSVCVMHWGFQVLYTGLRRRSSPPGAC